MDKITIYLHKNVSTTIYRSKTTDLMVAVTNNKSPVIKGQISFGKHCYDQ